MRIIIAAGGTGGHIFPALSVAQEMKRQCPDVSLLWIGTSRSREKEVCEKNSIPLQLTQVTGMKRSLSPAAVAAMLRFCREVLRMRAQFRANRPDAVVAFGGYVSAPVCAAAVLAGVPLYLQEQNTVPGVVTRIFASRARCVFLGLPLADGQRLRGTTTVTGTPVRVASKEYDGFAYPQDLDRKKRTVLICGGSQGALSMNRCLVEPAKKWLSAGTQVVWQTGEAGFAEVSDALKQIPGAFVFETMDDPYPYYAIARVLVGRSGASSMAEAAYFGLPCVLIPLPWATENHQWKNAGWAEVQGWAIRVAQADNTATTVAASVARILDDQKQWERMGGKAIDHAPSSAASDIVDRVLGDVRA